MTAAAVILIVLGALGVIGGLVLVAMRPEDLASVGSVGGLDLDRAWRGIGILSLVLGGLQVIAGVLVLRRSNVGRILAISLAALGVIGALGSLSRGTGVPVIALGLNGFVLYALIAHRSVFPRAPGR